MANESVFSSSRTYGNVSGSISVSENFLNTTETYTLFSSTQMYENSLNHNQTYKNFSNCEDMLPNNSTCKWTLGPYSLDWDMTVTTEVVVNSIVCMLGIIGNIYALVIILRKGVDTFVLKWRKSMAICDLLLLVCDLNQVTISRISRSFLGVQNYGISYYTYLWVLLYPVKKMVETTSAWITVSVVIERCVFLWRPPKALSMCRYRKPGIFFLFIAIFVTSINFPRFREYEVQECYDADLDLCSHEIRTTFASSVIQNYREVLDWIHVYITYIVPFVVLIVSSSLMWRMLHKLKTDQEKMKEIVAEMESARIIILFVLLFCVCRLPKLIEEVYANEGISVKSMTPFSNLMVSINSAVNFIIYLLF